MATFVGTTNSSLWTYKIEAVETSYSIANKTSTIQVKTYLGRKDSRSYLGGSYSNSVSVTGASKQTQNGSINYPTYIDGGAWLLLKTFTFTVPNTGTQASPTRITVSSSMSSSAFTPSSASAEGVLTLTVLHTDPLINSLTLTETNSKLTNLSVPNNTIVQYLSKKSAVINVTTYDNASISKYDIYHNNVLIGTGTTNTITIDFANVSELIDSGTKNIGIIVSVNDSLGGYSTKSFTFPVIKYTKPTIEATSTNIKRKTGGGTTLTDNKALLNFVGTCYKGSDVVGNNNRPTVQYKIWETGTTEPSYTSLTISNTANVTVKDFELSNLLYLKTYNYKIKIYDVFTTTETIVNLKVDKLPTGVSVWTEYKDRVDFINITQNNVKVLPNNMASVLLSDDWSDTFSAWTSYKVPLNTPAIVGDKLTFNSEESSIVIGAGVNKIKMGGSAFFDGTTPNGQVRAYVGVYYPNGTARFGVPAYQYKSNSGAGVTVNVQPIILEVSEGEKVQMVVQTGGAGTVKLVARGTAMLVEVVE